jgi:hypothetical protein
MDIQHISVLIETLSGLGFSSSIGRTLLFNACLQQKEFSIKERMCFGGDTINYQLYFKEDTASKNLSCSYYDATLRKAVEIAGSVVNGIDVVELEKRMGAINWDMLSEGIAPGTFNISDKSTWKQEETIEKITKDLEILGSIAEGAPFANLLKYKFWKDSRLRNSIPELETFKSNYELSQRFYIINGNGITTSEAYRFLNNRWMERQIHATNRLLRQSEIEQREVKVVRRSTDDKKRSRHSKEKERK